MKTDPNFLRLLIGKVLKDDMISQYGSIVLPRDKVLDEDDIRKAMKHPVLYQSRRDDPDPFNYQKTVNEATIQLQEIFRYARHHNRIPLDEVQRRFCPMVREISANPTLNKLLQALQAKDDYTIRHSVAVSILSTLIATWMGVGDSDLASITLAATLHDIGKMRVSDDILNKPGRLTQEEYAEMQKHTIYGYQMLKETVGASHRQALVALQHHERMDGTGYPLHLASNQISLFARIVSIADVFHAMSSKRIYHDELPLYQVLDELQSGMFGKFDAEIGNTFLVRMMETLVGDDVILTDGRIGTILLIHRHDPVRPLLQMENDYVDLSTQYHLKIASVI
ncbi:HD-GYP domain-containing protein [Ferroacidibacillus organovorans]|uniref:HD-GYP domain-containing protein n=1 Tax=Ferroacidibacillus organovorans TaxID=1765683 RepID=A0A1V4ETQ2_9BACL|nr:HD-GYP domain-containing protein [Ferroacidibacillus organovorans]OPG16317.1 hypothetical protein B2M26_07320 [Ferroacidibacillus organovorans]